MLYTFNEQAMIPAVSFYETRHGFQKWALSITL